MSSKQVDALAGPPVYFVLHIPKTAGQTIQGHFARHCAPGAFWAPPAGGVRAVTANVDFPRIRVLSSHHVRAAFEPFFAGREIRRAVLLRDPVELQVSYYNFRMMNYLAKGLGTYSFALHVRALPRNFMAHWLLHDWAGIAWPKLMLMSDKAKYDLLNGMLARFWFVGRHTDCDRLVSAIAQDLSLPAEPAQLNTAENWKRQVVWRPLSLKDISEADVAALRARLPVDQALWESWRHAGFETAAVRPRALGAGSGGRHFFDEAVRPAFLAARFLRRDFPRGVSRRSSAKGDRAREAGDWAAAARHYRAALSKMPEAPGLWTRYGIALRQMGDLSGAEEAYRQAFRLEPEKIEVRKMLAGVLRRQGRVDEARELLAAVDAPERAPRGRLVGRKVPGQKPSANFLAASRTQKSDAE